MPSHLKQWYPLALALAGAPISLAVLRQLPDRIVVHWDMSGTANGWMTAAGVVIIAVGLFLPAAPSAVIIIGAVSAAVVGPAVYSYFTWKREVGQ